MASGDPKFFAAFFQKAVDGTAFDINAGDVFKMGLVTNAVVPAISSADPRWGAGGSTNFSSSQVGTATAYSGPITLTNVVFTRTLGVLKFDFDDVAVLLDAAGFTDAYWAIVYDDTVAGKFCVGFIDLGGPVSIQSGGLNINLNAGGFGTHTYT